MGAGAAVLAHDNRFNRWVAGPGACFFQNEAECAREFDRLLDDAQARHSMKLSSLQRFREGFSADTECQAYERLLKQALSGNLSNVAQASEVLHHQPEAAPVGSSHSRR